MREIVFPLLSLIVFKLSLETFSKDHSQLLQLIVFLYLALKLFLSKHFFLPMFLWDSCLSFVGKLSPILLVILNTGDSPPEGRLACYVPFN